MSSMFNEQVGVDFNVGGNYSATLAQMIASSDQYARSADTLIGKIASLNVVTVGLLKSTTALTGVNKVATSEAAAYQQQLAGIASTAAVTGKSFDQLKNSTLALARYTGNLGQSVQIMEALSASGVKAGAGMDQMAKSWAQLGAATGFDPVAIGTGLQTLDRQFRSSGNTASRYGDVLVSLTKNYGGSAAGALSFAQALGPMASSVGMSEAAVLGLSAAMSRAGTDGAAGATAIQKVLADMQHTIRDGTPEIRIYASALGMTQDALGNLFKNDPSQVLSKFFDTINKGGVQASRTLEALGLDAPRTVRAIQAVSAQGNLNQYIQSATDALGGGATAKGAAAALGGVNEEAKKLQETLAQTVQAAGAPFLGFLTEVLKVANMFADAIRSIVSSPLVQWIGTVAAPLRLLGSGMTTAIAGLGILGVGRQLLMGPKGAESPGGLAAMLASFRGGLGAARGVEGAVAGEGLSARAGGFLGRQFPEPFLGTGMGNQLSPLKFLQAAGVGGLNWGANFNDMQSRAIANLTGKEVPYSVPGQALQGNLRGIWAAGAAPFRQTARAGEGADLGTHVTGLGNQIKLSGIEVGRWAKQVTTASGSMNTFGGSMLRLLGQTAMGAGQVVGGGASLIGRGLGALGITPMGAAVTAGIAGISFGVEKLKGMADDASNSWKAARGGINDVYSAFNSFADAAGIATKGVIGLGVAAAKTTQEIAGQTGGGYAPGQLNPTQVAQARSKDYKASFTAAKGSVGNQEVLQAAQVLAQAGPNASPDVLNNLAMSLEAAHPGQGQQLFNQAQALAGKPAELQRQVLQSIGTPGAGTSGPFGGLTPAGQTLAKGFAGSAGQAVNRYTDVYGPQATALGQSRTAKQMYEAAMRLPQGPARKAAAAAIADTLQMGDGGSDYIETALNSKMDFNATSAAGAKGKVIGGLAPYGTAPEAPGYGGSGTALGTRAPEKIGLLGTAGAQAVAALPAGTMSTAEQQVRDLDRVFGAVKGSASGLGDALYGAEASARKNGTTVDQLSDVQVKALNATQQALMAVENAPTPQNIQTAGAALATTARAGAGGNIPLSTFQLQAARQAAADAGRTGQVQAIDEALRNQQRAAPIINAGQSTAARWRDVREAGRVAAATPAGQQGTDLENARQAALQASADTYTQQENQEKQFIQADKELKRQWVRQQEDANIQVSRAMEDFHTSRVRAQRDFNISIQRMVEDSAKSLYDPYKRIQAQSVWDTQSLLANMAQQNQAIAQQTQTVQRLRRMGLSQQAVDTLSLSDPAQAQQAQRLLGEANAGSIAQLNAMARQRGTAARGAVVNENNVGYRRQREDFQKGLHDQEQDLHKSLGRMNDDLARSHKRSQQDLALMFDEVTGNQKQLYTQFVNDVAALPKSVQGKLSTGLKDMYTTAWSVVMQGMGLVAAPSGKPLDLNITIGYTSGGGQHGENAGPGHGASAGNMTVPSIAPSSVRSSLPNTPNQAFQYGLAETNHSSQNWHNKCDHFVGEAYGLSHSGYTTARAHWNAIPAGYKGSGTPPPGALAFWNTGSAGHVALSVGNGRVFSTDFVRDGHVDVANVADITKQWGGFMGWSFPYFGGRTAPIAMGDGGIAQRAGRYTLAERGTGEAVIPLNDRGARVLAETMVRYSDQAAVGRTSQYATHSMDARSYAYDQRVMVTGPVTIPAEDPVAFARKMEDRARQARLVQPVGRP